jgi:hypothetical protein
VPLPASQNNAPKPSRLVALTCAAVVAAYDRRWLAQPLSALVGPEDVAPETLSRLKARLLGPLEGLVARLHRRGRPKTASEALSLRAELEATRTKLELAASVIAAGGVRSRALQDRLVAAYGALEKRHAMSLRDFCTSLGLSERTFRSWRNRKPAPPQDTATTRAAASTQAAAQRGPLRPRVVPAQPAGDGGHDTHPRLRRRPADRRHPRNPGRRHKELLRAFAVTEQENSDVVVRVLGEALGALPGAQAITDQGTPYIARATQQACEAMEIEPAPQVEGAPTDKAPLERAWGTVKRALAPLLGLTDRVAAAVPQLRSPALARAALALLLGVYLRVYSGGRRHLGHPLEGHDPAALDDAVARAMETPPARKTARASCSCRSYTPTTTSPRISPSTTSSVPTAATTSRTSRLPSERCASARAAARSVAATATSPASSATSPSTVALAAPATTPNAKHRRRRHNEQARFEQQDGFLAQHPELRLRQALDALAMQWDDRAARLAWGGAGWGRGTLVRALREMRGRAPLVWSYDVDAVLRDWRATPACPAGARIAISALLELERAKLLAEPARFHRTPDPATITPQARRENHENARPPPPSGLTI